VSGPPTDCTAGLTAQTDSSPSKSTLKSLSSYVNEHFREASCGVYPTADDSRLAIVIVANKYSPKNYWYVQCQKSIPSCQNRLLIATTNQPTHRNGRWRSLYLFDPSSSSLDGIVKIDVHYYEDGNVRLQTSRESSSTVNSVTGPAIVREIAACEKRYQDDVGRGFSALSEGAFKALRRQLPVTRQKI